MQSFLIPAADPNATPSTIAARRKLAEAMLAASTDAQPVQSWSQGAAKIAQAMMGGLAMRRAGQEEAAGRKSAGEALAAALNGNPSQQDYGPALSNPWIDPSVVTGIMNHRDQVAYQQQQMGLQQQQFQLAQDQAKQSQAWHDQQMQLEQDKFRWEQGAPQRNIDMLNGVFGGGVPPAGPQAPAAAAAPIPAPMQQAPAAPPAAAPPLTYQAPGIPGGQGVTAMPGRGIDVAAQQAVANAAAQPPAAAGGATPAQATLAPAAPPQQPQQDGPRIDQGSIPIPPEVMRAVRLAAISNPAAGAQMIQEYRQHQADQMRQDYYQSPQVAGKKQLAESVATQSVKDATDWHDKALSASNDIDVINQGRDLLNGGMFTGRFADWQTSFNSSLEAAGIKSSDPRVSNTQAYAGLLGNRVGNIIKQFGAGTGLSDADRKYAQAIAGGDVSIDEPAIRKLLDIGERLDRATIERYNKQFFPVFDGQGAGGTYRVDMPAERPPQASQPGAPSAGAIEDGYRFKGGNPADPNSWEKVQ